MHKYFKSIEFVQEQISNTRIGTRTTMSTARMKET